MKPLPPFPRPNPLPSLTSRPNDPLLSTSGAAGGHTGPHHSTKNPVVHAATQAFARYSCPTLPPPAARDHHAPPYRPGTPGDLPSPGQRFRSHGRRGAGSRGKGVPELSDVRHLGPRLRQGPMRNLRLRLPGGVFLQGTGSLSFMQRILRARPLWVPWRCDPNMDPHKERLS